MGKFSRWSFAVLCGLVLTQPASGSDLSKFMDGLFHSVNNRPPTGTELNYHTNLARDQGPLESAIVMYGSDYYYYYQSHGDPNLFVQQFYAALLGRAPRPDEQQYWVAQLQRPGVRRADLIRWFCQTNHITHLPSLLPSPPVYPSPTTPDAIASGLYGKSRLLEHSVTNELGSTYYGNKVIERARRFQDSADRYRQVAQDRRSSPQQVNAAVTNLERTLQDFEGNFYRVPGKYPQSKIALQQVSQLVASARNASTGWGRPPNAVPPIAVPPIAVPPIAGPQSPNMRRLLDASRRFSYGLLSYQNVSPFYANLIADMQGLSTQIESLSLLIRQGQRRPALRQSMWSIVDSARHIATDVSRADNKVQRGWLNVQSEISRVAQQLGVDGTFNVQPSRPVIINRPAWPNFPYQPSPAYPSNNASQAVTLADQLAAQVDEALATLSSSMGTDASAIALVQGLRNFKQYVAIFRQSAAQGSFSTSLSSAADRLSNQYQQISRQVAAVVSRNPRLNLPSLYRIGELVTQIQYAVRGATR